MTDLTERLRAGNLVLLPILGEAADEIERLEGLLKAKVTPGYELLADQIEQRDAEIERLRAVIVRAKDALLDGQSTQRVHDLLVTALVGPKP